MARDLHTHGRRFLAAAKSGRFERSLGTAKPRHPPQGGAAVHPRRRAGIGEINRLHRCRFSHQDAPRRRAPDPGQVCRTGWRRFAPCLCSRDRGWGSSGPGLTLLLHPHRITKRARVPGHHVRPALLPMGAHLRRPRCPPRRPSAGWATTTRSSWNSTSPATAPAWPNCGVRNRR